VDDGGYNRHIRVQAEHKSNAPGGAVRNYDVIVPSLVVEPPGGATSAALADGRGLGARRALRPEAATCVVGDSAPIGRCIRSRKDVVRPWRRAVHGATPSRRALA